MQKECPSTGGLIDALFVIWDLPIRPILTDDRLRNLGPIEFRVGRLDLDFDQE
jgi:hypothetical protein